MEDLGQCRCPFLTSSGSSKKSIFSERYCGKNEGVSQACRVSMLRVLRWLVCRKVHLVWQWSHTVCVHVVRMQSVRRLLGEIVRGCVAFARRLGRMVLCRCVLISVHFCCACCCPFPPLWCDVMYSVPGVPQWCQVPSVQRAAMELL